MKIGMVSPFYPPEKGGGIAAHVYDLSLELAKRGIDVTIYTIGENTEKEDHKKINVFRILRKSLLISQFSILHTLLKHANCDLLHAHGIYHLSTHTAAFASKFLRKPLITSLHGLLPDETKTSLRLTPMNVIGQKSLIPWTLSSSHKIIVASSLQHDRLRSNRLLRGKLVKIPNFVNLSLFDKSRCKPFKSLANEGDITLLYVGFISLLKGIPTLFMAFKRVLVAHPNTTLVLVGNISAKDRFTISNLLNRLGLRKNVKYIQYVDRRVLPSIYAAADLFVFPSTWDYFPMAILEAQACELPVVATDVGAIKEIVINELTGFLVRTMDYESMAQRLIRLIKDKELRRQMGKAARAHIAKNFNINKQIECFIKTYNDVANDSARD